MHKETAQNGKYFCFKVFSPDDVYAAVATTRGYRKGNSGARHIRKREIKIWQNVSSSGSTFGCEWWRCALWWTSLVASNVSFSVLIKRLDLFFFLIGNSWRTQKWVPVNLKSCLRFIFSEAKDGKKKTWQKNKYMIGCQPSDAALCSTSLAFGKLSSQWNILGAAYTKERPLEGVGSKVNQIISGFLISVLGCLKPFLLSFSKIT